MVFIAPGVVPGTSGPGTSGGTTVLGTQLGLHQYAPNPGVTYLLDFSGTLTVIDATNLAVTFTTPASGPGSTEVLVRVNFLLQLNNQATAEMQFALIRASTGLVIGPLIAYYVQTVGSALAFTGIFQQEQAYLLTVSPSTTYKLELAATWPSGGTGPPGILCVGGDGSAPRAPFTMEVFAGPI